MAGHNKWSKIKHKKVLTDSQKSKVFGKLTNLLTAESMKSGGDRSSPGLKSAIDRARAENMPAANIDRAIERGISTDESSLEKITYEAYGPGGCAILIETLTNNRNRTAAEIKHILSKHNISIGTKGSASWMFTQKDGNMSAETTTKLQDADMRKLESLVSEIMNQNDTRNVYTNCV